jgi:hypothetical protein
MSRRCCPVEFILKKEEKLSAPEARMLAISSGGRLGLALNFYREGGLEKKNEVLDQLLHAYKRGELEIPLGTAPRPELLEAMEWWAGWWRDLLILSVGGDSAWVMNQDRLKELEVAREKCQVSSVKCQETVETLLNRLQYTYRVQDALRRNAAARVALGALLSHR